MYNILQWHPIGTFHIYYRDDNAVALIGMVNVRANANAVALQPLQTSPVTDPAVGSVASATCVHETGCSNHYEHQRIAEYLQQR